MESVCSIISEAAGSFGDRTALVTMKSDVSAAGAYCECESISYRELYEDVLRFCSALRAEGISAGERVAVLLDNCVEMVVSEWACLMGGFVWVALNTRSSPAENLAILNDSRPSVLLLAEKHIDSIPVEARRSLRLVISVGAGSSWRDFLRAGHPVLPPDPPSEESPVRLRYTSGTAGLPKGAVLPRRCYDASVEAVSSLLAPIEAGDVLLQAAPMTHASGAMLIPHLRFGATALLLDRFEARPLVDLIAERHGTAAFMVPTMLLRFLAAIDDPARLSSLRSLVYGGAAMPTHRLLEGIELLGPVFIQIYGLTESTWPVTALTREQHLPQGRVARDEATLARLSSCGRPTAVGELRIVDATGRQLPGGEVGEILVRGRNTMLGYWDAGAGDGISRQSRDKGLDEQGWMHTGDLGFRDAEGFVSIVDRLHDMIVSGGFNVYPREVEDVLCSHPAVLEAAVIGVPDPQWGESVHACVVLRSGAQAGAQELIAHCAQRIAGYKKPRSLDVLDELPRNSAGKILRRRLRLSRRGLTNSGSRRVASAPAQGELE